MKRLHGWRSRLGTEHGFTLIELVVVIIILGVTSTLLTMNLGTFAYWKEEGFLRRLTETIVFLHRQAVVDQAFYRLEFNLKQSTYRVGAIRPEDDTQSTAGLAALAQEAGNLTLELADFLNPSPGSASTLIPPPSFPSLFEPEQLPNGVSLLDLKTARGKENGETAEKLYITFSPRGFSEFAVVHLRMSRGAQVTILVNPFTGLATIYRDYRDFEWTYGRENKGV